MMLTSEQLLAPLARLRTDEVVVTSMSVVRPWGTHSDHHLDFASADSAMGHTADLALGIAMARPERRVICLNGDGSMLMCLGTLATIIESGVTNYILIVVENGTYEITGNQALPGAGRVDIAGMARSAGFPRVCRFNDPVVYEEALPAILSCDGPVLLAVQVEPGNQGPISRSERETASYLRISLAEAGHRIRRHFTSE